MGLGLLGRGVNVALFLLQAGAQLTVTDLRSRKELQPSLKRLKPARNACFILGRHRLSDFRNADMVIRAAGVPFDSPYVKEARKCGVPVEMDSSLFAKIAFEIFGRDGITIVGVTGTRGKSTVTHIVYEMARRAGLRAHVGGNVRGMATLPLIKSVKAGDVVILELDSWQLQGFGDARISPHVAVFTNFMSDHMNYYRGSMKRYFRDKANIFLYQRPRDIFITRRDVLGRARQEKYPIPAKTLLYPNEPLPAGTRLRLRSAHNEAHARAAAAAAGALGIPRKIQKETLALFRGVPGRLEEVCTRGGFVFINDTTSTTPQAAIAALNAFSGKPIALIAGGNDKKLPYADFARTLNNRAHALILLPGTATQKIKKELHRMKRRKGPAVVYEAADMKKAVSCAYAALGEGGVVLLSPGATSFGSFKNEFDRGDQFVREAEQLCRGRRASG